MSRFVRASKVRHLFCQPDKKEEHYTHINLATSTGDHQYIKANSKFFAVATRAGGGGALAVIPHKAIGKQPNNYPKITGHTAAIFDFEFNPFHDQIIATGSDDCTAKVWGIPGEDGLTENLHDPLVDLDGHMKKVVFTKFHPTAANVLATASADRTVKLWDIEAGGEAKQTLEGAEATFQDLVFNYNGSQLATSSKDKKLRIYDPRTNAVVQETQPHEGSKCFKICYQGKGTNIITVGFTRQSKRQFRIWDSRALGEKPIHTENIDQSAGVIMPFFDEDSNVLFLAGKGDGNIRFYEIVDSKPYAFSLSEHRASNSQKGFCFIPKRHCDTTKCEVMRGMKLTSNSVEGLSFIIPRKSDRFQADIYPDTYAGQPSMTCEEFFGGKDADPKLVSMDPKKASSGGDGAAASSMSLKSKAQLQKELDAALARIKELEAQLAAK